MRETHSIWYCWIMKCLEWMEVRWRRFCAKNTIQGGSLGWRGIRWASSATLTYDVVLMVICVLIKQDWTDFWRNPSPCWIWRTIYSNFAAGFVSFEKIVRAAWIDVESTSHITRRTEIPAHAPIPTKNRTERIENGLKKVSRYPRIAHTPIS